MIIYPKGNRFIKEVLEGQEYKYLYKYPVVIDIGANIGTFSVWIYDNADKIYAVEPVEKNVDHLLKTVDRNKLDKISVHQLAISDSDVTQKLEKKGVPENGGWRISEAGTVPVRCQTLKSFMEEQFIDYADLVKIDVENHEVEILGAKYFPYHKIGAIMGECHGETEKEVEKILTHMGYIYTSIGINHFIARK